MDIVERLRATPETGADPDTIFDAADEIQRLRQQIDAMNAKAGNAHVPTGIEAMICDEIARRQSFGIAKYGKTVSENALDFHEWLQHLLEELLDASVYTKRAMEFIVSVKPNQWFRYYVVDQIEGKVFGSNNPKVMEHFNNSGDHWVIDAMNCQWIGEWDSAPGFKDTPKAIEQHPDF